MIRSFHALLALLALLLPWQGALSPIRPLDPGEGQPPGTRLGEPAAVTATGEPLTPDYSGCGGVTAPVTNYDYEQEVVEMVNAEREDVGLPPLKRVEPLDDAARYHAVDMGQDNYFAHTSYDVVGGSLVAGCSFSARIGTYYPSWNSLAENIAAGYPSPGSVMAGWMSSPGHKDNILRSSVYEIGVGYYAGSGSYYHYWVQDFGRRSGVYPLVINREAGSADSRDVEVYLYGSWEEMRLRNDGGDWSAWMPFQNELDWTLGSGVGDHTVSAEMRSGGVTVAASDEIYLAEDSSTPVLGNLPDQVDFLYRMSDDQLLPASKELTPLNTGDGDPLDWSVSAAGSWFTASPDQGGTPDKLTITPNSFNTNAPQTYTGSVTVTVTSPPGAQGSPHVIQLTLVVLEDTHQAYLPAIQH